MTNVVSMPSPRLSIETSYKCVEDEKKGLLWQVDLDIRLDGKVVYSRTEKAPSLDMANGMALSGLSGLKVV